MGPRRMRRIGHIMTLTLAGWSAAAGAVEDQARLERECTRVSQQVYPLLILAVMAEGPMDCGDHHSGEVVDCAANENPAERAAHARRYAIRQRQEAAYKTANDACGAWRANRGDGALQDAAAQAIAAARATDDGRLPGEQR